MTTTDTSESGLEALIVRHLTGGERGAAGAGVQEEAASYSVAGYIEGRPADYDRSFALDTVQLMAFLRATQPEVVERLGLDSGEAARRKFLSRLQGEITKRGIVDVLRMGVKDGPTSVDLFFGKPSAHNLRAVQLQAENIFSVTRQLRYSNDEKQRALDLVVFINGLPIATFELKNSLTRQTVDDAVRQYQRDRNPRELLFQVGRCLAHFAVDDSEVRFCAQFEGPKSVFLPFNKGWNNGAGNPPNPGGIKTDYLWRELLSRESLTDIIQNYALLIEEQVEGSRRTIRRQIFPRYHQRDVVQKLLADAGAHGVGQRYLIQHSAGSGKSNSIAWLARQLVELERDNRPVFDSVIVVTDRRVLDRQIEATIKQFSQVRSNIGHADRSGDLREFIESGKKIIITTVQKFPYVYREISNEHRNRTFAIIIDEAHSSQSGRAAAQMNRTLSSVADMEDGESFEDAINRIIDEQKILTNASYFAFTATPKNKTLEVFGKRIDNGDKPTFRAFHTYSMKQAIQEGFILDVLRHYTPVDSYYRLIQTTEDDPEVDVRRTQKKLKQYVESHEHSIRRKAEIMVDDFHDRVIARGLIGGEARAMVVTSSIERAILYWEAISACLIERGSPYRAIVAFSGEKEHRGIKVTEASLNNFPSNAIPQRIREHPYRFLVCADKFQTGYDEPLLQTMYVDKPLSGIKAVQTLSRLNRAKTGKRDTFVLDFQNTAQEIEDAFAPYYTSTVLSGSTDPNKLHDLKADLDKAEVYTQEQVESFVHSYLQNADRDHLDPILDQSVAHYLDGLDEQGQVDFKAKAKAFCRTYSFLSAILPYRMPEWELLSTYLTFLLPKLPAPKEEDLSGEVLGTIDMDSYRVEVQKAVDISLSDDDGVIEPVPVGDPAFVTEPEMDHMSNVVREFNDRFGNIEWGDTDKIERIIAEELPAKVAQDEHYINAMRNNDRENAREAHDRALESAVLELMSVHAELFKHFSDDQSFKHWLSDLNFRRTYQPPAS